MTWRQCSTPSKCVITRLVMNANNSNTPSSVADDFGFDLYKECGENMRLYTRQHATVCSMHLVFTAALLTVALGKSVEFAASLAFVPYLVGIVAAIAFWIFDNAVMRAWTHFAEVAKTIELKRFPCDLRPYTEWPKHRFLLTGTAAAHIVFGLTIVMWIFLLGFVLGSRS